MRQALRNLLKKTPLYLPLRALAGKVDAMRRSVWLAVKQPLLRLPFYFRLRNWNQRRKQAKEQAKWERAGKPAPPPHVVKEGILREYARSFGIKTLVETGTCYGDMVEAMRPDFDRIYSIELSKRLHEIARRRFSGVASVTLIQGDSGLELGSLVGNLPGPALFWLDGHYSEGETAQGSKDTPIFEELEHIFSARREGDVILIDDARCFGTYPFYPTLDELRKFILVKKPGVLIAVEDDAIRITPGEPPSTVSGVSPGD
jgi:hypothetical protein